jgi:hypothetical protein
MLQDMLDVIGCERGIVAADEGSADLFQRKLSRWFGACESARVEVRLIQ